MPRSDPARSDYCATRHLLRHLGDVSELRRNPLSRSALVANGDARGPQAVAERVSRTLGTMDACAPVRGGRGARQTAILLRVDVAGHAASAVAADLGISIRQFHRERRLAHARFVQVYRIGQPASVSIADRFPARLLERATCLADSGETSSARAILDGVVSGGDADARCEALVRIAELHAWMHQLDRAGTALRAADELLAASPFSVERQMALRDAAEAAALNVRWLARGPMAVEAAAERPTSVLGVRATVVRAAAAVRSGEAERATQLLGRVAALEFARVPEIAVEVLTLRAEIADFTAVDPLLSERLLVRAVALAREHGLYGRELYAKYQLYSTRWMRSRTSGDRSAYRRLVERTDRALPPRLRSALAFCTADIEVAIGHPRRALVAANAAAAVSTNAYETLSARALAAGALLRLGRADDAGSAAASATDVARARGHARIVALTQRISAESHLARGNKRAARAAIEESIDCARRFSSAHVLAQAQALLGKIVAP